MRFVESFSSDRRRNSAGRKRKRFVSLFVETKSLVVQRQSRRRFNVFRRDRRNLSTHRLERRSFSFDENRRFLKNFLCRNFCFFCSFIYFNKTIFCLNFISLGQTFSLDERTKIFLFLRSLDASRRKEEKKSLLRLFLLSIDRADSVLLESEAFFVRLEQQRKKRVDDLSTIRR